MRGDGLRVDGLHLVVGQRAELGEPELVGGGAIGHLAQQGGVDFALGIEGVELFHTLLGAAEAREGAVGLALDLVDAAAVALGYAEFLLHAVQMAVRRIGVESGSGDGDDAGGDGPGDELLFCALFADARRHEVDVELAALGTGDGGAGDGAEAEGVHLQRFGVYLAADGEGGQRVEEFNGQVEGGLEEFDGVGDAGAAAADVGLDGGIALVLRAVVVDGALNFGAQAVHRGADDGGQSGVFLAHGVGMAVAQRDLAVLDLEFFRIAEAHAELARDGVGDEGAGGGDGAGEEAAVLREDDVGGLGADVEDDDGIGILGVAHAVGVVERGDGAIDAARVQAVALHLSVEAVEHVLLDGDEQDFMLSLAAFGEHLVGVDDVVDGEGDVLLGLVADLLGEVVHVEGGQLDEAHEDLLARDDVAHVVTSHLEFFHHFTNGVADVVDAHALLHGVEQHIASGVAGEGEALAGGGEDRHAHALRSDFQGDCCFEISHIVSSG